MKKTFLAIIMAAALLPSLISCKQVSVQEQIDQLTAAATSGAGAHIAQIERFDGQKEIDYLTLTLAKELKAKDVWTLEDEGVTTLVADFRGRARQDGQMTVVSAALDDKLACATVLDLLSALKEAGTRPRNDLRAVFYHRSGDEFNAEGLKALNREIRESGEKVVFDLEISSNEARPVRTFILEDHPIFVDQIFESVPNYLNAVGDFTLTRGEYPNMSWPFKVPVYRYTVGREDPATDLRGLALFDFLLN